MRRPALAVVAALTTVVLATLEAAARRRLHATDRGVRLLDRLRM